MLEGIRLERGAVSSHSHASLIDIKRWNGIEGDLFDSLLVYQNVPTASSKVRPVDQPNKMFSTDHTLEIIVTPAAAGLSCCALYKPSAIPRDQARWMLEEFDFTLSQICCNKSGGMAVSELWTMSPAQTTLVRAASSGPEVALPFGLLHHAFEALAKARPHARAVEIQDRWLSYGELDALANSVASDLAHLGVCVGSRVAVIMDRCLEFPIGLLAALKVGAAMMPLDVGFPAARLAFMVADAGVCAVVTTRRFRQTIVDLKLAVDVVTIDAATPKSEFVPSACHMATKLDEAYIVYTSGSTGKPKGVPVLHHSAVNSMERFGGILEIKEDSRVFQLMAIGFDGFQADMWESLSYGATLVMRSEDDLSALSTASNLTCTPTALSLLGDPNQYPQLKVVAVAGEAFPVALKDLWAPRVKLFNLYGPSECAIMTHGSRLSLTESIAIGSVLPNVHCYVLDDNHRQVPFGILGEFYLSGICVSPGYINLPEMTEDRFLVDPFGHGRMYKTGDLGRLLPNGQFEIAGRQDSQVKLKGYRIELDEVANAMMQHLSVKSAAAIVKDKTHLVGYFTPAHVNVDALRQCVADQLPVYMVPAVWVGLDDMPQNSNGKIDVKVLQSMDVSVDVETLETDVELKMATVWANVLGVNVSEIGRQSSFFALGGDSLSVVRVIAACKALGLALSGGQMTKEMLLWRVAKAVSTHRQVDWPSAMAPEATKVSVEAEWPHVVNWPSCVVYPVTPLQAGMLYATINNRRSYVLQNAVHLADALEAAKFEAGFKALVQQHDILRTTFLTTSTGMYQVIRPDIQELEVPTVAVASLADFLEDDLARGFYTTDKFFVRLTIVNTDKGHFGVLTIHHCLYDGWSMTMFWNDLADLLDGKPLPERPSFRHVVDYIQAQDTRAAEEFWRSYLNGVVVTSLETNGIPRNCLADSSDQPLSIDTTACLSSLSEAAQTLRVTVAELVKFAWAATVRKYTRQNDVVFGQVVANRDIPVHDVD
ncbi:hypothetical protein DYB38_013051, partial [Aphanomyces astaci]